MQRNILDQSFLDHLIHTAETAAKVVDFGGEYVGDERAAYLDKDITVTIVDGANNSIDIEISHNEKIVFSATAELYLLTVRKYDFSSGWLEVLDQYLLDYGSRGSLLTFESPSELTHVQIGDGDEIL